MTDNDLTIAMCVPKTKCNSEFKDDSGSQVKVTCVANNIIVGSLSSLLAVSFIMWITYIYKYIYFSQRFKFYTNFIC